MADKIDQIKVGSTSYDIDLPKDASIDIAAAVVGGTAVLTQADLSVLPATGNSNTPIYIDSSNAFAACSKYAGGTNVTLNGTSKSGNDASFYAPTSITVLRSTDAGGMLLRSTSNSATWYYSLDITASANLLSVNGPRFYFYAGLTPVAYNAVPSSNTTGILIQTYSSAVGTSTSATRVLTARAGLPGATSYSTIFSIIGPRYTSASAGTWSFSASYSVNTGIMVGGSLIVGAPSDTMPILSDNVGIFPAGGSGISAGYIGNSYRKWKYGYFGTVYSSTVSCSTVSASGVTANNIYAGYRALTTPSNSAGVVTPSTPDSWNLLKYIEVPTHKMIWVGANGWEKSQEGWLCISRATLSAPANVWYWPGTTSVTGTNANVLAYATGERGYWGQQWLNCSAVYYNTSTASATIYIYGVRLEGLQWRYCIF